MKASEWLAQAKEHRDVLLSLIDSYHPASHAVRSRRRTRLPITAHAAELACAVVRERIAADDTDKAYPRDRFIAALDGGDVAEITSLLNAAWFGVPESTSCWQIEGFREAVALIEDMPDDIEDVVEA